MQHRCPAFCPPRLSTSPPSHHAHAGTNTSALDLHCNVCECVDGEPAMGAACPNDGDHQCVSCAIGFFLDARHRCVAHTNCSALGKTETKPGTETSDAECAPCSPSDHAGVSTGEFLFTGACSPVRCSNAGLGRYYNGSGSASAFANATGDCEHAACDHSRLQPGQFFAVGWANSPSLCADLVMNCSNRDDIPGGYRFDPASADACALTRCITPPQPGRYFNGAGECNTSKCESVAGFRFVSGWADDARECPMQRCPEGPRGTYYERECESKRCSSLPVR